MKKELLYVLALCSLLSLSTCGYNDVMDTMNGDGNPPAKLTLSPADASQNNSRFSTVVLNFSEEVITDNEWSVSVNGNTYNKDSANILWSGQILRIPAATAYDKGSTVSISATGFITKSNSAPVNETNITFTVEDVVYDAFDELNGGNESTGYAADMGSLNYNATQTSTIDGCISGTDRDFFKVTATDTVSANYNISGTKNFHVSIRFLKNPEGAYGIKIWQGRINGTDSSTYPGQMELDNTIVLEDGSGSGDILGSFDWGLHLITQSPTPGDNVAGIFTSTYIIEVVQHEAIVGDDHNYQIEIGNGQYTVYP